MRDMLQNHMLQLLCLIAMDPPVSLQADRVRDEKLKVLQSIRPFDLEMVAQSVVRGQYAPGKNADSPVPGYRLEPNVRFSPDKNLVIFTSNMFGPSYVFGVETGKSGR